MDENLQRNQTRRGVVIAGGGIAGLTAALALARVGMRAVVLEGREEPSGEGAGLQISPNAYHILATLGLERMVRRVATKPNSIQLLSALSGKLLTRFELGDTVQKRHGAPYLVVHRADLHAILLDACAEEPDIEIRSGHRAIDCAVHRNGVTVMAQVEDTYTEVHGAAALGADGVWSTLRHHVDQTCEAQFTGSIAWRALIPMDQAPAALPRYDTALWLGPDAHLVHYPIRNGQYLNLVLTLKHEGNDAPTGRLAPEVFNTDQIALTKWPDLARKAIEAPAEWSGWPVYTVQPPKEFSRGPVCLIGDAAHAMEPHAAQGAACAMEDAIVLAREVGQSPADLPAAFSRFSKRRRRRVMRTMLLARGNRRIYHMKGMAQEFRDLGMSLAPQALLQMRMDWLYGWKP